MLVSNVIAAQASWRTPLATPAISTPSESCAHVQNGGSLWRLFLMRHSAPAPLRVHVAAWVFLPVCLRLRLQAMRTPGRALGSPAALAYGAPALAPLHPRRPHSGPRTGVRHGRHVYHRK